MNRLPDLPDSRNKDILIHINGKLYKREDAKVSVFDSSVQGGDAVWEGLRIYDGKIFKLDAHIRRMINSAKAMAFESIPDSEEIKQALFETLKANKMFDEAHVRLTLTRGQKTSSGMSPKFNKYGPTLIVLAEWKKPVYDNSGIKLITSSIRRNPPQSLDSKIHHNNLINNILAKIEANLAEVDDAVMLDIYGYISETNATNIFLVKDKTLYTPFADSCLPGITRSVVLTLAETNNISCKEKRCTITEMYTADEMFVTGTMGEITPVILVDGRIIGSGKKEHITAQIQELYHELTLSAGEQIPFD